MTITIFGTTLSTGFMAVTLGIAALLATPAAQAQFLAPPPVAKKLVAKPSNALTDKAYRKDAARHLYAAYVKKVKRGKMPPMLFSVMVVETEIDKAGQVVNVNVVRKPAADIVEPWVVSMIRQAAPFPAPQKIVDETVRYTEVWLVDKSGVFQLDTLTEGQR
jgi:periplasmic protein TonB